MTIFNIKHWFIVIEDIQLLIFEWKEKYLGVLQIDQKKINWNQMLNSIHYSPAKQSTAFKFINFTISH